MENQVIRCSNFVKIVGMITTAVFGVICIVTLILGYPIAALCFLPFVFLGASLLLVYKKQTIVIDQDKLTFHYILKKSIEVRFAQIRCLLFIPLGDRTQMALIDRQYQRIVTLDTVFGDLEVLFDALGEHDIEIVDFQELVEQKKDVSKYVGTFNAIERNYYKSVVQEREMIENVAANRCGFDVNRAKKILRVLGIVFIILDGIGFVLGGKMMMVLYNVVILGAYALYLWYYPYIYIETKTKKAEEVMLQMPFLGAAIALLLNLITAKTVGFDSADYFKMTFILAAVFLIPFVIKSLKIKAPQRLARKLSVVCSVLFLSFTMVFPINFLLTFEKPTHETIVIIDKDVDTGNSLTDYQLVAMWRGKEKDFNVSTKQYLNTNIGDIRQVCIRQSVLGLEYYNVHE